MVTPILFSWTRRRRISSRRPAALSLWWDSSTLPFNGSMAGDADRRTNQAICEQEARWSTEHQSRDGIFVSSSRYKRLEIEIDGVFAGILKVGKWERQVQIEFKYYSNSFCKIDTMWIYIRCHFCTARCVWCCWRKRNMRRWRQPCSLDVFEDSKTSRSEEFPAGQTSLSRFKWLWTWKCWVNIPNEIAI